MQLKRFDVEGLFGQFDHSIPLPTQPEDAEEPKPSIAILHGPNGVGKTTVLRMLSGLMRLDFTVFRQVPFNRCKLAFSTGEALQVAHAEHEGRPLEVSFGELRVLLHPEHPGPLRDEDDPLVTVFRETFFKVTEGITFDFVETSRLPATGLPDDQPYGVTPDPDDPRYVVEVDAAGRVRRRRRGALRDSRPRLAERVARFIADAQVDYRRFFATSEPDLFPRIMQRLTSGDMPSYDPAKLMRRLTVVREQAKQSAQVGLEVEAWDYEQLVGYVESLKGDPGGEYALTVLATYTEFLESRAEQRKLVADRLRAFERILAEFYMEKEVQVDPRQGLRLVTRTGEQLQDTQLSSGEFHLLYLMVTSLVTRRRGTVIAIDEPEMSMHIEWQRKLVRNLVACASNASPQFIFATHSPDIVADYRDALIEMTPGVQRGK